MCQKILVYDDFKDVFRDLDANNYDDIVVGTVFLKREALDILKKHFIVCGYTMFGKNGEQYIIDIRAEDIALLEGTYNCLPKKVKRELIDFNITQKPSIIWSRFFFQWQFVCDWEAFTKNGSFIELMSNILGDTIIVNKLIAERKHLVFPSNYEELCEFVQNAAYLLSIDLYRPDYVEEANYIIDSLLHGYHVNMTFSEIETYCFQISSIMNGKWGIKNE